VVELLTATIVLFVAKIVIVTWFISC